MFAQAERELEYIWGLSEKFSYYQALCYYHSFNHFQSKQNSYTNEAHHCHFKNDFKVLLRKVMNPF